MTLKQPCVICGENRYTEKCHIIPRKYDHSLKFIKTYTINLIILCPTHHKLFDKGLLNSQEYEVIKDNIYRGILFFLLSYQKYIFDKVKTPQEEQTAIIDNLLKDIGVKAEKDIILNNLRINREQKIWQGN